LYLISSTLHFIDHEFPKKLDSQLKTELKKKYELSAKKIDKEIRTLKLNEKREHQIPVRTISPMQEAQQEIILFQRQLLLMLHKDGKYSDAAIRQVEKDMDIDELKFNQLLPKEENLNDT